MWVGLRPLVGQADGDRSGNTSQVSREHHIGREKAGFWTVTGGKWTTYRSMAEQVMEAVVHSGDLPAPKQKVDTRNHALVGAPAHGRALPSLRDAPGMHLFGTLAEELQQLPGQDNELGLGLTEAMVRYSARHEWAITVEDMLARRWRVLFLDARLAQSMAPCVAQLLQQETGMDPQLDAFLACASNTGWTHRM